MADPKTQLGPLTPRPCGISSTQLYYIRSLLDYGTGERAKGMQGGFLKEKDFKDSHVTEVTDFLAKSFYFPHMLDFTRMNIR